jgi:hypothetical protein
MDVHTLKSQEGIDPNGKAPKKLPKLRESTIRLAAPRLLKIALVEVRSSYTAGTRAREPLQKRRARARRGASQGPCPHVGLATRPLPQAAFAAHGSHTACCAPHNLIPLVLAYYAKRRARAYETNSDVPVSLSKSVRKAKLTQFLGLPGLAPDYLRVLCPTHEAPFRVAGHYFRLSCRSSFSLTSSTMCRRTIRRHTRDASDERSVFKKWFL